MLPPELANLPVRLWAGRAWRFHSRRFAGDDASGSLLVTGRYHRGRDQYAEADCWPVLYTSLGAQVALGERLRHTTRENLARLAHQRQTRLGLSLQAVLDLCDPESCDRTAIAAITTADLCRPGDYRLTHEIAQFARTRAEAIRLPSCTRFPEGNLLIFPDRMRAQSRIWIEDTRDPDLLTE